MGLAVADAASLLVAAVHAAVDAGAEETMAAAIAAAASQVPIEARRQAFGQNWHGAVLMAVRERMRREAADGGVWVVAWDGGNGTEGGHRGGEGR